MKTWYLSKTLWLNCIAVIALLLQTRFGFVMDPEAQTGILAVINVILRIVTKAPLNWNAQTASGQNPDAGYINIRLLMPLFLIGCLLLVLLAGCASTGGVTPLLQTPAAKDSPQVLAGKSLLAVKSTIIVAATTTDSLCKAGTMPADKCAQAKAAYGLVKPAYDAAVDAYLLMQSDPLGPKEGGDTAAFGAALLRVQSLAGNLLQLSGGAK